MDNRKNNWLKLQIDFFNAHSLKKLRKIAGGDKYLIIYLKLMLLTINSEGHYEFQNLEPNIEDELALILDEETDNIKMALSFLRCTNLVKDLENNTLFFEYVPKHLGRYDNSAERVAAHRLRKRCEAECNALQNVTCNKSNDAVTESNAPRDRERDRVRERVVQVQRAHDRDHDKKLEQGQPDFIYPNPHPNPENPHFLKELANNAFENWKHIAAEQNAKFTLSEWDTIYGYILAKPSLQQHQIRTIIILLAKWANEALDIEDALLTGQNYKSLVKPRQRVLLDHKNNRLYGNALVLHRNRIIESEELQQNENI